MRQIRRTGWIDANTRAPRRTGASVIWVFHDLSDPHWFRQRIDAIASARDVVKLADLAREPGRKGRCAITFDDGWRSVWTVAHPLLSAKKIPYTVFVCTDMLVGGPVPWFVRAQRLIARVGREPLVRAWDLPKHQITTRRNLLEVLKTMSLPALLSGIAQLEHECGLVPPDPGDLFLTVEQVRALGQNGADVGSHTHRHAILSRLNAQEQQREIDESVRIVETVTGRKPTQFAYPNGRPSDFDERAVKALRQNGIEVAVTTTQRYLRATEDVLRLPRIGLSDGESALHANAKQVALSLSPARNTWFDRRPWASVRAW
jgi:peptidoglycan/xylan/chitin deacetylase (PgdA/CDA1 family)